MPSSTPISNIEDDLSILSEDQSMPIAIVGMGFRGPADATNVESLWEMILEGREAWSRIPDSRWNNYAFHHPDHARNGTINVDGGHFLADDISLFDAPFFNMTSDEAAAMDPQQRLLLEVAYEGLENAGIPLPKIMGSQTSCFVGSFNADYTDLLLRDPDAVPMYQCTNSGQSRAMTANRVSYFFDLKGPSVTIDTACSGSLVALHLACQSLRTGDASMAIAAGVNVILSHEFMSTMTMMKFLSPDGRCRTFDENANGYARGEAIGCLILKPLENALRDKDPIRAVIRGSGSNQDGRTPGITLPNGASQEALIRHVYDTAGLNPCETEFVEAHGTGTQAGDPIETGALSRVFCAGRSPGEPLRIGSIKTNVGHLEGTSGVAGVIKAVLMLENRTFLPNRNFISPNPRILLDEWKLKIQLTHEPWETTGPHRVSVNSFGYGGSNAHIILEDTYGYLHARGLGAIFRNQLALHPRTYPSLSQNTNPIRPRLFILSGFDDTSTTNQMRRLRTYLLKNESVADDEFMNNLAFTINERHTTFICRAAVTGSSAAEVAGALAASVKITKAARKPAIGFVFTGQGAQWCGMGRELFETYPVFRRSIERIDAYLARIAAPFCLVDEILENEDASRLNQPIHNQSICSALQIALVDLLDSWGISPESVTGHSSGEIAAAYAIGALSMEGAMLVAYSRGVAANKLHTNETQAKGGMLAVGMSVVEVQPYIASLQSGKVVVACVNSPSSVTISGDVIAIEELEQLFREKQIFCRRLAVEVAYHSHHMELVGGEYLASISDVKPRSEEEMAPHGSNKPASFFSSVIGREVKASDLGPQYWVRNLLGQVKFVDSVRALCFETNSQRNVKCASSKQRSKRASTGKKVNVDILLEIGPHAALAGPIKQIIKDDTKLDAAGILYGSILTRKQNAVTTVLTLTGMIACSGYPVNFQAINNPAPDSQDTHFLIDLPPYAWNHSRSYWAEPRLSKTFRNRKFPRTDLLGVLDRMSCPFEPRWRNFLRVSEIPWLRDHKIQSNIVYPAAGYIVMAIEAIYQQTLENSNEDSIIGYTLRDISIQSALVIHEAFPTEVMISLRECQDESQTSHQGYEFHVYSVTEDNRWTEHCKGFVGIQYSESIPSLHEEETLKPTTDSQLSALHIKQFYERLAQIGLEYGPCFANLIQAHFTDNLCFAEITIPDIAAVMPMNFQYPFLIHPCTLDSIFHTIFVNMDINEDPAVPVYIDEIFVSRNISRQPGGKMDVHTQISKKTKAYIVASIKVTKKDCAQEISIKGLRCKRLGYNSPANVGKQAVTIAYSFKWEADPDLISEDGLSRLLPMHHNLCKQKTEHRNLYENYALQFIRNAISGLDQYQKERLNPHRKRQFNFFADIAQKGRSVNSEIQSGICNGEFDLLSSSGPEGRLLCAIGERLPAILREEITPSTISKEQALWDEYWNYSRSDLAFEKISRYLEMVGHKDPIISILEIEANTGNAWLKFMKRIARDDRGIPQCSEYTLTHPNPSNFETGEQALSPWSQWLSFKQLDIEEDLDIQGIKQHHYDVIIVPYGLYTVKSKQRALINIHNLLKPEGRLILVDPVGNARHSIDSVIFANFPGWWIEDRFGYSQKDWDNELKKARFLGVDFHDESAEGHSIIISRPLQERSLSAPAILIVTEEGDYGVNVSSLRDLLVANNLIVEITDFANAQPTERLCIILSDLKVPVMAHLDDKALKILQQIFLKAASVLWVTRGGTVAPTNPDAALVNGFARTARSESGVEPIVTLDLDGRVPLPENGAAKLIYNLVCDRILRGKSANSDTEYIEREGILLIPRVMANRALNQTLASSGNPYIISEENFHQEDRPLRAAVDVTAQSEQILFVHKSQLPDIPDDHVRIQIHAICLDKLDAEIAFGEDSSSEVLLGSGRSGTVYSVGKAVCDFVPGDRVACLGSGTISSFYQDRAAAFQKIPSDMSFELAASLPQAYCAAVYGTHHLARISSADKILIHGATGLIAQALVELCHIPGAEVFVIIETEKEKGLVFSMNLLPDDHIIQNQNATDMTDLSQLTRNDFDVIINCANPENSTFQTLWKYVGTSGRFIQLWNQCSPESSRWWIPRLKHDVLFASLDIKSLQRESLKILDEVWNEVVQLFQKGLLHGPRFLATYSMANTLEALEALRSKQHLDSAILTAKENDIVKIVYPKKSRAHFLQNVSYMLVGGLGGIGRAIALWMANNGAKTLIFVSRSGLSREASQETIRELKEKDVCSIVYPCDISDSEQVQKMVADLTHTAPPIRGVIQAAMVLKDIHIEKMTIDDYNSVLQPKYAGTWNLHRYLPENLDWFVMLSSISGIIGNATQAAYAAGSTFMDAFSAYRSSLSMHAVSLDLGVITDAGYLAENRELAKKMAHQGFQATDTATLISLVEMAIATPPGEEMTSQIVTGLGQWKKGQSLGNFDPPLFAQFRRQFLDKENDNQTEDLAETLRGDLRTVSNMEEASSVIYTALSGKIASHLSVPVESINPSSPITEYGIDSHVAVELRNWILNNMESTVPILEILASSTLLDLSIKIASKSQLVQVEE